MLSFLFNFFFWGKSLLYGWEYFFSALGWIAYISVYFMPFGALFLSYLLP